MRSSVEEALTKCGIAVSSVAISQGASNWILRASCDKLRTDDCETMVRSTSKPFMSENRQLELICIGRTCVDLYGEQIGAPLEDVQSFQMYVGGSASNICIGTARLGIRSAMIARVGDEPLGRF